MVQVELFTAADNEPQAVRAPLGAGALQFVTDQRPPLDQIVLVQPSGHAGKLPTTSLAASGGR
jgi:hypothetical protein